jgi:hypothetical protein
MNINASNMLKPNLRLARSRLALFPTPDLSTSIRIVINNYDAPSCLCRTIRRRKSRWTSPNNQYVALVS